MKHVIVPRSFHFIRIAAIRSASGASEIQVVRAPSNRGRARNLEGTAIPTALTYIHAWYPGEPTRNVHKETVT